MLLRIDDVIDALRGHRWDWATGPSWTTSGPIVAHDHRVVAADDGGIELVLDLPGVSPTQVDLHADGDQIVVGIAGPSSRQERRFTVEGDLDVGSSTSSMKDGRLRVKIPKRVGPSPKRIAIATS